MKYTLFLSDFTETCLLLTDFSSNIKIPNFMKIHPVGPWVVLHGLPHRGTDMRKLMAIFSPTFVFIEQGCKNSRKYSSIYNEKATFWIQIRNVRSVISEELNRTSEGCNPLWRAESFDAPCVRKIFWNLSTETERYGCKRIGWLDCESDVLVLP